MHASPRAGRMLVLRQAGPRAGPMLVAWWPDGAAAHCPGLADRPAGGVVISRLGLTQDVQACAFRPMLQLSC